MKRKTTGYLLAGMLVCPVGLALAQEEDVEVSGAVAVGVRAVDDKDNSAKFQEFRDLDDGGFGQALLRAYKEDYYLQFDGRNLGLDDQYYDLRGGDYNNFDATIFYNEIPHNLTFGARTFFTGIGTGNLDFRATNRPKDTDVSFTPNIETDPNLWQEFDYQVERKEYGGQIEIDLNTPFFVNIGAQRSEKQGVKPLGQPTGVFVDRIGQQFSAFGNQVEMPEPVEYENNDLFAEAGYRSKDLIAKVKGSLSDFKNDENFLTWRNPFVSTERFFEVSSLPPDNDYWKLGAQGVLKNLPFSSTLALEGGYAKLENDATILNTIATSTSGGAATSPTYSITTLDVSEPEFEGDIDYTTLGVALSSYPARNLFSKVYYKYLKKDNNSPIIEFTNPLTAATSESEVIEHDKNNAGLDLSYGLPWESKIMAGYEFLDVDRTGRQDITGTTDHIFSIELRNEYLEFLAGRVKYKRIERDSDFANAARGEDEFDDEFIFRFLRRFDATDKSQDAAEIALDLYPMPHLDFGFGYRYKMNDYEETVIGRTEDTAHEFYVDAAWELPKVMKLTAFFDYEDAEADSLHRNFSPGNSADPFATPTASAFNFEEIYNSDYYAYGITALVPLIADRLDVMVSWQYQNSDGTSEFTTQGPTPLINIEDSDDYSRDLLEAKAIYAFTESMDVVLGYIYDKFEYRDAQLDNYQFFIASSFLSGAYTDYNYDSHIGYAVVSYEF